MHLLIGFNRYVGPGDAHFAANGYDVCQIEVLGVLVAAYQDLDVGFLVYLLLGPLGHLFLGELFAHYDVGTVFADINLGEVAGRLRQRLISGIDGQIHHVIDFLFLEGGRDKEEDNQDEHDVDHAGDIDYLPFARRAFASAVHDFSAALVVVFLAAGFLAAVFFAAGFLAAGFFAGPAVRACWATNAVPDSSMWSIARSARVESH